MLKNSKLLGILLSIVMVLAFSVCGYTFDYRYTQESGTGFFVGTTDKADALEDSNELRQIINDLGTLLGHSKMDGTYPKDLTTGGDIDINRITTKTATATLTVNESGMILVSCAVTPYSLFLPTAVGNSGLVYHIIKTDDNINLITIDADGTETINGSLTHADLNYQWAYITIKSDNVNWIIVNSSETSTIRVDNLISPTADSIAVKPDGDTDDFFTFKSLQDRPTIKREGGKFIYFESTNVYDVGISFRLNDTYSGTLNYEKDNHMMTVVGKNSPFGFKANSDYVNYIKFQTASSIPEITVVASNALKVNAGGTNALLLNHAGGSVGIGTSSPSGLLDLNVATDADAHLLLSENDVTKWDFYNDHIDDALQIKAGSILIAELDTSGNLDIKSGASYKIGGTTYLGNVEDLKVKLDGTAAPSAATDDVTLGYAVGSRWFDVTNDKEYVCLDNTDGAAVWTETTQSGGGGAFTDLTDTPANYTDKAGKTLKVNSTPDAVEFANDTNVTTKTTTATLTVAEQGTILVSASSAYTITLPTAVGNRGLTYHFIKTDANYNLITLDGDGTETIDYENSTDAPCLTYPRLNTYRAEVALISDNANWQVIDEAMGQVPEAKVYIDSRQENIPASTTCRVQFNAEVYDIGSNFNMATWVSGTADGNILNHLQDDGNSQFTAAMVGMRVKNTTDVTEGYIITFNDAGDVTLSSDVFPDGNENYTITNAKYIVPIAGKYEALATMRFRDVATDKYWQIMLQTGDNRIDGILHSSSAIDIASNVAITDSLSVDDEIYLSGNHNGAANVDFDGHATNLYTSLIIRLISKD